MRSLLLAGVLGLLAGCQTGGAFNPNTAGDPDASPPDAVPPPPDAAPDAVPPLACAPPATSIESGHHNAGMACTQQCHNGTIGPKFFLGGTLYTDVNGIGGTITGATIHIEDSANRKVDVVTAQNGNFWTDVPLVFPIKVFSTQCPNVVPMIATVGQPGDCNAANCHDTKLRIHM